MRKNKAVGRAGSLAAGWASLGRVGAGAYLLDGDGWPGTTMSSDAMLVFAAWLRRSGRSRQPLMILPNQLPAWECWGLETAPDAPWELSLPGQLQAFQPGDRKSVV